MELGTILKLGFKELLSLGLSFSTTNTLETTLSPCLSTKDFLSTTSPTTFSFKDLEFLKEFSQTSIDSELIT